MSALLLGRAAAMVAVSSVWPQPVAAGADYLGKADAGDPIAPPDASDSVGWRLAAVIRLGTLGTPAGLRRITPFLSAADSSLRLAAARALVRAGDELALARITAQASTEAAPARLEALMILREAATLPGPARHAAERALGDSDPAMRLAALELLTVHPSRDSVPAVAAMLGDGNREVRLAAIRLLGMTADRRGLLPLLDKLESPDRTERLAVIEALAHYRAAHPHLEAGPALLRQLDDPNDDIRLAAIDALGQLRWPLAVSALAAVAMQKPEERLGRRAAVALGAIGSEPAVKALIDLLRRPAPTEEVTAALVHAGTTAVKPVAAVLRDGLSTSAIAAAEILARIGDRSATSALAETVTNATTGGVAISAAGALMALRDPAAVPALLGGVMAPRYAAASGVREACLHALTAIGDARAAVVVDASANDTDPRVRAAALNLAAAVRARMPRQLWSARLRDQDASVRLAALAAAARVPSTPALTATVIDAVATMPDTVASSKPNEPNGPDVLESMVTDADRPRLLEKLPATNRGANRLTLLRALAAVGGPAVALPGPIESMLLDILPAGEAAGRAAAEVLSSFQLHASTWRALLALAPALQPSVRARLCPALAHARATAADELLAKLLTTDPEAGVRAAAAWSAQSRRTEPAVRRALTDARSDGELAVRKNATAVGSAASPSPLSSFSTGPRWLRIRMTGPGGAPLAGRWARISAGLQVVWGLTDDGGEAIFTDLPGGPYRLSTVAADQIALTSATASGRSPATTPVGP